MIKKQNQVIGIVNNAISTILHDVITVRNAVHLVPVSRGKLENLENLDLEVDSIVIEVDMVEVVVDTEVEEDMMEAVVDTEVGKEIEGLV